MSLREDLGKKLPAFLNQQRWYGGPDPYEQPIEITELAYLRESAPALVLAVASIQGQLYQLLVGLRPAKELSLPAAIVDRAVIGPVESDVAIAGSNSATAYDALLDPELELFILELATSGEESARRVRPVEAEQSNTSLVYDERLILKVFRKLQEGPNPDVEVTEALAKVGFPHVAKPVSAWQRGNRDLAVCQQYLADGTEGWALALTSLRDLLAEPEDPAYAGGDFASEAYRLGGVTGLLHLALADSFGTEDGSPAEWAENTGGQLAVLKDDDATSGSARELLKQVADLDNGGRAIRVHGDYHLGQVLRTDHGWYVFDFEGEPTRTLEERRRRTSPLKDVAGMMRSFQYASQVALVGRSDMEREGLPPLAQAWELRNREAFLGGYLKTEGIQALLPEDQEALRLVLSAFELEKAAYELDYERRHRPDWAGIPQAGLDRLLAD